MDKTFIALKRGLFYSPKHRQQMGMALWLYVYLLDQADWEDGKIYGWTDKRAADDLKLPLPTVRYQRRQLEEHGYIACRKTQRGQVIAIHKYINPRTPGRDSMRGRDSIQSVAGRTVRGRAAATAAQSDNPSHNPSGSASIVPVITPYPIQTPDTRGGRASKQRPQSGSQKPEPPPPAVTVFRDVRKRLPPSETWPAIAAVVGSAEADLAFWREVLVAYAGAGWNRMSVTGPLDWFKRRELPHTTRASSPRTTPRRLRGPHDN